MKPQSTQPVILSRAKNLPSTTQSGRSMVEMLGVLALMGVLGIAAVAGFRSVMDKHMANSILEDAQVAFIEINSRKDNAPEDWEEVTQKFKPVSEGVEFFVKRDPLKQDYVLVSGIEKRVCQQLLAMRTEKKLNFYQKEGFDEFATCQNKTSDDDTETNAIVFAFNGLSAPAECDTTRRCDTLAECPPDEESGETSGCFVGYCTATGRCHACNTEYETMNWERTACICNPVKALSCTGESGESWCCGEGKICGAGIDDCPDSDGTCRYTMEKAVQESVLEADCSYTIEKPEQTSVSVSDCNYTIYKSGTEVLMTENVGCGTGTGKYCYLKYSEDDCSPDVTNSGYVGTIYGVCVDQGSNSSQCKMTSSTTTGGLIEKKGCGTGTGKYCYLKYSEDDCSPEVTNSGYTGTMYGVCVDQGSNSSQCKMTSSTTTGGLVEELGCPVGQYCYLKWLAPSCQSELTNSGYSGTIHGLCIPQSSNSASCSK